MSDDYNLHRFLTAQAPTYDTVLEELRAGRKSSHKSKECQVLQSTIARHDIVLERIYLAADSL
jgi:uncharacterized protein (DUF1810 family)